MLDDSLECRNRPIVHVRTAAGDLAQSWGLERMLHLHDFGKKPTTAVVRVGQSDVVEPVIREIPPNMADRLAEAKYESNYLRRSLCRIESVAEYVCVLVCE